MATYNEMTRHAFISHMEDYIKKLLKKPSEACVDDFLKSHGIDGPLALKILLKRKDPKDEYSAILMRKESIKDNGFDENGKKKKDSFVITYKLPRKDYLKKMRNLFISLFESNIIEDSPILSEGAWGTDILQNDRALDFQTEFCKACLKNLTKNAEGESGDGLWAAVGTMIDFLKKFKDNEIKYTDEYAAGIDFVKGKLKELYYDENWLNDWSDPKEMKSSIKKNFKDLSELKYQKDIMQSNDELNAPVEQPLPQPQDASINEDGECAGATSCDASSGEYVQPLFGKPLKREIYVTEEQALYLKDVLKEEDGDCPVQSRIGGFGFDAPVGDGKSNKGNKFFAKANDHRNICADGWNGKVDEEIKIKEKNKGKFNATKKRTGKSTEELTHSKNPVTRKRAIFAQNAARWSKK